jgi:hypothetical protein
MNKESLIKGLLMIGGGYLAFLLIKGKKPIGTSSTETKSAEGDKPVVDKSQADVVMNAYSEALRNGESPSRLTELNKELMKEFGMRCYVDDSGSIVVCDVKGNTIATK